MTDIEYSDKALKQLQKLEKTNAERIIKKIEEATEWTDHRLELLKDYPFYKIRAGEYRAIIDWRKEENTLFVVIVGHRRNVYDTLERLS